MSVRPIVRMHVSPDLASESGENWEELGQWLETAVKEVVPAALHKPGSHQYMEPGFVWLFTSVLSSSDGPVQPKSVVIEVEVERDVHNSDHKLAFGIGGAMLLVFDGEVEFFVYVKPVITSAYPYESVELFRDDYMLMRNAIGRVRAAMNKESIAWTEMG